MASWDIFHSGRLEVHRGLSTEAVREGIARGEILQDDLARPAGSSEPWTRLADVPDLLGPGIEPGPEAGPGPQDVELPPPAPPEPAPPALEPREADLGPFESFDAADALIDDEEDVEPVGDGPSGASVDSVEAEIVEEDEDEIEIEAEIVDEDEIEIEAEIVDEDEAPTNVLPPAGGADAGPVLVEAEDEGLAGEVRTLPEEVDPLEEDEAAAEFTLSSSPTDQAEPIDLTAMVDVAFQLVLFFLVTATTIYFKALEIPEPSPDDQDSVAQEVRTLDDLLEDYILVEIDAAGGVMVDREPIEPAELVARMRQAREDTLRTAMLLMADFSTPHANAVRAYDAANELGLGIAIAKPTDPARADGG